MVVEAARRRAANPRDMVKAKMFLRSQAERLAASAQDMVKVKKICRMQGCSEGCEEPSQGMVKEDREISFGWRFLAGRQVEA